MAAHRSFSDLFAAYSGSDLLQEVLRQAEDACGPGADERTVVAGRCSGGGGFCCNDCDGEVDDRPLGQPNGRAESFYRRDVCHR